MGSGLGVVALVAIAVGVFFARHEEPAERARFLRRAGFAAMAVVSLFLGLFIVGDAMTDPGGWEGAGLVAIWAVPFAVLVAIARHGPKWAGRLFAVLVAALVGMSIWFALNPGGWRSFEDHHGPIRAVVTILIAAALGLYGLKRTAVAGVLLMVVAVVPMVAASFGHGGAVSLAVASSAPFVTGVLYLLSAAVAGPAPPPAAASTAERQPKAA